MSSRDQLLKAVSLNKPDLVPMPEINIPNTYSKLNLTDHFIQSLEFIGGKVKRVQSIADVKADMALEMSKANYIVNTVEELGKVNSEINSMSTSVDLEKIYISYVYGQLGVAENGSIWIDDSNLPNRLLPFICQHLVIVLNLKHIVPNMHEAYKNINTFQTGYGLFLAGPSKTADIEQSLVIGAHGARSLTVYLFG